MKNVFMFILLAAGLYAQEIRISCGYSKYNLSDQKVEFESAVAQFNSQVTAFKIPIQTEYPANYYFSGSVDIWKNNAICIGACIEGGKTNAYAQYRDVVGSISFKGTFSLVLLGVYVDRQIELNPSSNLFLGGNLCLGPYNSAIDYKFNSVDFAMLNSTTTHSYSGTLLCFEPNLKYEYRLYSSLWLTTHLGYRFGWSVKPEANDDHVPSEYREKEENSKSVDPSGFIVGLGIAFRY